MKLFTRRAFTLLCSGIPVFSLSFGVLRNSQAPHQCRRTTTFLLKETSSGSDKELIDPPEESEIEADHDEDQSLTPRFSTELLDERHLFTRNPAWLEEATLDFLDEEVFPIGKLTEDDVESVLGLMAAWARKRSVDAALTVERLLKRVVDDIRYGNNPVVRVNTRFYSYVSCFPWQESGEIFHFGADVLLYLSCRQLKHGRRVGREDRRNEHSTFMMQ